MENNIDKKMMTFIKKKLKSTNELIIKYIPSDKEKEYLSKYNINTKIILISQKGIVSDCNYDVEYCKYSLN